MNKKYFFFDIDGTLTDEATHKIVPSAEWTLHELEKEGHFVSIATGRAHYKTRPFSDAIGIKNLVCCGGACLVLNDKQIQNIPLPIGIAKELLRKADEAGLGYVLMLDDSDHVYMKDFRFLEQNGRRTELTSYVYKPDLNPQSLQTIYKIYLAITEEQEPLYPWIHKQGHLRMGSGYLNFQYDAKKEGILQMMRYLNASPKDVVVFGDGKNDLVMFDETWTCIAMGNACEELKRKANYVTSKNTDDGIKNACVHFGWIQPK